MKAILSVLVVVALIPAVGAAQGVQTGTLTGTVKSVDGIAIADAAVVVTSPALQGERTGITDVNGMYLVPSLPPGTYTLRFAKEGLTPAELTALLPLGATASVDAMLSVAQVAETVLVEGVTPPAVTTTQTSANITADEVNALPMGRTPYLIAEMMPGLTTNTPNRDQLTISGGFAYDNVFLVDGVDVNDNLLGSMNDLYIEDAIGEVQVLTSGITAEYGRFSGGVVNVITKSGSNMFGGSYRTTLTRPSWSSETPFERANNIERGKPTPANPYLNNKLSHFGEFTAGGPLAKDRVWFFAAGRFENSSTFGTMPATAVPYTKSNDSKRYEGKLTGRLGQGHTLQGSFVDNNVQRENEPVLSFSIDKAALISPIGTESPWRRQLQRRAEPAHAAVRSVLAEGLEDRRSRWHIDRHHRVAVPDPHRDAVSIQRAVLRRERSRTAQQPAADGEPHVFRVDAQLRQPRAERRLRKLHRHPRGGERPELDRIRVPRRHRDGGRRACTRRRRPPDRDVRARRNPRAALDSASRRGVPPDDELGVHAGSVGRVTAAHAESRHAVRVRRKRGDDWAEIAGPRARRATARSGLRPRRRRPDRAAGVVLAVLGKYNATQFSRNTNVGNSDRYTLSYVGPAGQGRSFAPGFDLNNYSGVVAGTFPALNVRFADDLSSPLTTEYTLGVARTFGARSYAKAVFVQRKTSNFIEEFILLENGKTPIVVDGATLGQLDNILYENSDEMRREYQALQFMAQHRVTNGLSINGHWTLQLKNDGNFEGETPNPTGSVFGDYPEMLSLARSAPEGHLDDFQRSKVRLWADYQANLGRYGSFTLAPIYRYNSGKTYSLVLNGQPLSAIQAGRNPGYAGSPTQQVYFGDRGSQSFKGFALVDLAVTYGVPVWRSAQPWIKFESFNLLNNQKLIAWDTTITADPASPRDEFGLPTGYVEGPKFGQGTSNTHYPAPRAGIDGGRMFDVAIGFRF